MTTQRAAASLAAKGAGRAAQPDSRATGSPAALLNAARALFADRGYAATSVSDIVDAAGTSVGLLYYHFGSKQAIFEALFDEYQDLQERATHEVVNDLRAAGERDGSHLLLAGIRAYLEGAWKARDLIPILYGHDRPSTFERKLEEANRAWTRQNRLLLSGIDEPLAGTLVTLLRSCLIGLITEVASSRTARDAKGTIDRGTHLIGLMLAAAAAESRPAQEAAGQAPARDQAARR
jgi:AcrR family transcriptional regulator